MAKRIKGVLPRAGVMGWSDGHGFRILKTLNAGKKFGRVFLLEVVGLTTNAERKLYKVSSRWYEAATEKQMREYDLVEDCNGDKPERKWFIF